MANLTQRWTQSGSFFSKSAYFFRFLQRVKEVSPPPFSCAPVLVAEYLSVSLNMPKYPWKCLNKLFWLCQDSEHVWSSYMFDRRLKMPLVLNKPRFWISHGCICKGYADFQICLIMAPYASVMPQYALMSLNMPEHVWINCSDYARGLSMPWYSYNNIIIVTNVIMLQFLSARFVNPGGLLPSCIFLTRVRT